MNEPVTVAISSNTSLKVYPIPLCMLGSTNFVELIKASGIPSYVPV